MKARHSRRFLRSKVRKYNRIRRLRNVNAEIAKDGIIVVISVCIGIFIGRGSINRDTDIETDLRIPKENEELSTEIHLSTYSNPEDPFHEELQDCLITAGVGTVIEGSYEEVEETISENIIEETSEEVEVPAEDDEIPMQAGEDIGVPEEEKEEELIEEGLPEVVEEDAAEEQVVATTPVIVEGDIQSGPFTMETPVLSHSGLSVDQIEYILADTKLSGYGQAIYDTEQTYNINAYFIMGVAGTESGFGGSERAYYAKDCFGQMSCRFNAIEDGIDYFGGNMQRYKSMGVTMTPRGIDPTYSGIPGHTAWAEYVVVMMNQCYREL